MPVSALRITIFGSSSKNGTDDSFIIDNASTLDSLARILSDRLHLPRERLTFCIGGQVLQHDAEKRFFEDDELPGRSNIERDKALMEAEKNYNIIPVVVVISVQMIVQILAFSKTRFTLQIKKGKDSYLKGVDVIQLRQRIKNRLKEISPMLASFTWILTLIASEEYEVEVYDDESHNNRVSNQIESTMSQSALNGRQEGLGPRRRLVCEQSEEEFKEKSSVLFKKNEGGSLESTSNTKSTSAAAGATSSSSSTSTTKPKYVHIDRRRRRVALNPPTLTHYHPFENDLIVIVPRFGLIYTILYSILQIIWFFISFIQSFISHKYEATNTIDRETSEQKGGSGSIDKNDKNNPRIRRLIDLDNDIGQNFRHHRYAPGLNPHGEDLTLMVRQALLGIQL